MQSTKNTVYKSGDLSQVLTTIVGYQCGFGINHLISLVYHLKKSVRLTISDM